jgi:chromosome segregation ATPase
MVVGQISVATTAGISRNLKINVAQLAEANKTMESIIERAGPSVQMERTVAVQAKSLATTNDTMVSLNAAMAEVGKTSESMKSSVEGMQATSGDLAAGVESMNSETAAINDLLGPLPEKARSTHGQLSQIDKDSAALNTELSAISGKMAGYGLPPAKNVKAGSK